METYHIFTIKKEIYNTYKNNPESLYKTLYNLYNINKKDTKLGLSIYNEICYITNIKKLKEYIKLLPITKNIKNKYLINKNILIIKPSNIILKYNNISEDIIYILNNYYNYLFACNFKTNDFYWINELDLK
jgi:hypothetical protein